jgi:LmbE family N-acetylglucosaminyl deacetylase
MMFGHSKARIFVPGGAKADIALQRCSHMGIGAHQDDLEIMAFHGVLSCYDNPDDWFCGVTCTDGTGGPRKEGLEQFSPEEVGALRNQEQDNAAELGQYGAMIQLNYSSQVLKSKVKSDVVASLYDLLSAVQPRVVYTHNPADKHNTHVSVAVATLEAIRQLPIVQRPSELYGCEVWQDLDWLNDDEKVRLDVSGNNELAEALINCHDSQITPAKRYDLATLGRRRANATYSDSHSNTPGVYVTHAMDLSQLILDDEISLQDFVAGKIHDFKRSVVNTLASQMQG